MEDSEHLSEDELNYDKIGGFWRNNQSIIAYMVHLIINFIKTYKEVESILNDPILS